MKTIHQLWQESKQRLGLYHHNISQTQLSEMRKAFYAGVGAGLIEVGDHSNENDAHIQVEKLFDEMEQFWNNELKLYDTYKKDNK